MKFDLDKSRKLAGKILEAKEQGTLDILEAQNSSGSSRFIIEDLAYEKIDVEGENKIDLAKSIYSQLKGKKMTHKNINEIVKETKDIVNPHQLFLRDSKEILIENILKKHKKGINPDFISKFFVVNQLGNALLNLIDKNKKIKNMGGGISEKLSCLGLKKNNKLYKKIEKYNKYYNSTKHCNSKSNISRRRRLASNQGLDITVNYFETVRRIFIWYFKKYSKEGKANWDELKEIDYSKYNYKLNY